MSALKFADGGTITVQAIDDPICDVQIETRTGGATPTGSLVKLTAIDAAALITLIAVAMAEGRQGSEG